MEGYVFATATCCGCGNLVTFNPNLVPSYGGQPICRTCVDVVNPKRIENGLKPISVRDGAYEPVPESEVF